MKSPTIPSLVLGTLLLSACTTPNIDGQLTTLAESTSKATASVKPLIDDAVAREAQADRDARIAERKSIYTYDADCTAFRLSRQGASLADCTLIIVEDPARPTSTARAADRMLAAVDAYLVSLNALAKSDAPSEIEEASAAAAVALLSFTKAAKIRLPPDWAPYVADKGATTGAIARAVADQAKFTALRKTLRRGNGPFGEAMDILARFADENGDGRAKAAFADYTAARDAMQAARVSATPAEYAAAVRRFESAHQTYVKAEAAGPRPALIAAANAHQALMERLTRSASPEEIVAALERIRELLEATGRLK